MNRIKSILILSFLLTLIAGNAQELPQGSLVIVGGGLEANNKSVFNQVVSIKLFFQ